MNKSITSRLWIRNVQFLVNKVFSGTHCYAIKRKLLLSTGMEIGNNTQVVGPFYFDFSTIEIGDECWIGKDFEINGHGTVKIKNGVGIAPHVKLYTGKHLMGPAHARHIGQNLNTEITIGEGAMISSDASIVGPVIIGNGAVVMVNACVVKNVEDNMMVGGVPANNVKLITE